MTNTSFRHPVQDRYFEDYQVGAVHELGSVRVDQEELLAFARRFDPQFFHTDPEAASRSMYGGLIASGWHTASLVMRLCVEQYLSHVASLGSPGVDELRWHLPVRPGDELAVRVSVLEARRSRSRPDRGIVRSRIEALNQHRELVMSMEPTNFMLCREPLAAAE